MNPFILFLFAAVTSTTLQVSSPSFKANGMIPLKYTCEGQSINPAVSVTNIPKQAKSLALIVDDPDAPKGGFVHWVMWNIDPSGTIKENSAPGTQGKNGAGGNKYLGPCPPTGTHHYHFRVYALDAKLNLQDATDKAALETAMKGHILASGELVGLYKKENSK
ncbi:MAG TPA: YbhB/YbcL family Raf kinase inhibitor-like protein [Chitinophagaceae bacterium]